MALTEMALLGLGLGLSALGTSASVGASIYNTREQANTRELNEKLMREGWARDDKARQRMVTDLENAGLSKWLASGASPMTSSPVSLNAPQFDGSSFDALEHSFNNALSFMQTKSQTKLADKQGALADASTAVQDAEEKIKKEELKIKEQEFRIKQHDADVWSNRPSVASTDPAGMRYFSEGANLVNGENGSGNKYIDAIVNAVNSLVEAGENPLTNQPEPTSEPSKPVETKQQKEIQKLKSKGHVFMTYNDWLDSLNDYMRNVYIKHPNDGYRAYTKALKKANK